MKSLKEHFESILEACRSCAEVGDEDDPISSGLCYEENGIIIDMSFLASGRYHYDGDGYNTPYETYLTHVRVSVEEISGSYILNEDGDEEEIPDVELRELSDYIEKELPQLLED